MSAVTGVGLLAACGDPITAGQSWQAVGAGSSQFGGLQPVPGGTIAYSIEKIQGVLVDGHNMAVAGTSFVESCRGYVSAGGGSQSPGDPPQRPAPAPCVVLVNTGSKIYAASGRSDNFSDGFSGTFTSLSKSSATSTLTVKVSRLGPFYSVHISAH